MATADSNLSIDSSFDDHRGRYCSICYLRFAKEGSSVPRILSCGHSFCTGCLSRLIGNVLRGYIRCPQCKTDTMIPGLTNEVTKLAKNFGVLDLLESIDDEKQKIASQETVICLPPVCSEHENEPKKVYCLTDSEIICIYCQVYGKHSEHNCQLISTIASEYRQALRSSCEQLQSKKEAMVKARTEVNDTTSAVCFKEEKIMREVTHHFEWLRRKLHRRELQVKALLKNRTSAKCMLLDKQKRQMTELITKCEEQFQACQNVLSGPDHEVVMHKNSMENEIQALASQVDQHGTSPCTRDDLMCQLDPELADRMSTHGSLMKDTRRGESVPELDQGSSSSPSAEGSPTPGSDSTGDSEDQDIEWQMNYIPSSPSSARMSPRRRLEAAAADVILLNDDMDLTELHVDHGRNNNNPEVLGAVGGSPRGASGGVRGSGDRAGRIGVSCGGCGSPHPEQNLTPHRGQKRTLHPSPVSAGRPSRRPHNEQSTTSEESPDLSELSDMDLDINIRSAWSNRGGWSASQDTLVGAVGGASTASSPTRSVTSREVEIENRNGTQDDMGAVGGRSNSRSRSGDGQGRRTDPWEVFVAAPQRRSRSSHSRTGQDMKCSVFNCSTGTTTTFYVKCKNCSRVFCQRCTSSSISARRCYKRPRGHSFVFIPCGGAGNASANNNQIAHGHHQHGNSSRLSFTVEINGGGGGGGGGGAGGDGGQSSLNWHCANCSTMNKATHRSRIRTCIKCGRQTRTRAANNRPQAAASSAPNDSTLVLNNGQASESVAASAVAEVIELGSGGDADQQQNEAPEDDQGPLPVAGQDGEEGQAAEGAQGNDPAAAAAAAQGSSGISSSTMSSNDSGYENVCPSCATVNTEDAMHCSNCSAQLFL